MHAVVLAIRVPAVHHQALAPSQALVHQKALIQALQVAGVVHVYVVAQVFQVLVVHLQVQALSQALAHL